MLNRIGPDYNIPTIRLWLSRDPSLPISVALAIVVYLTGRKWKPLRSIVAPAIPASIPLVLWIWDIPFTRRMICHAWHDGRLTIAGSVVSSAWVYVISLTLYAVLLIMRDRRRKWPRGGERELLT